MPKDSKYRNNFIRKISENKRADGKTRYRVNLPKRLIESSNGKIIRCTLEIDTTKKSVTFLKQNKETN